MLDNAYLSLSLDPKLTWEPGAPPLLITGEKPGCCCAFLNTLLGSGPQALPLPSTFLTVVITWCLALHLTESPESRNQDLTTYLPETSVGWHAWVVRSRWEAQLLKV
jgi:hypothetical protein